VVDLFAAAGAGAVVLASAYHSILGVVKIDERKGEASWMSKFEAVELTDEG